MLLCAELSALVSSDLTVTFEQSFPTFCPFFTLEAGDWETGNLWLDLNKEGINQAPCQP